MDLLQRCSHRIGLGIRLLLIVGGVLASTPWSVGQGKEIRIRYGGLVDPSEVTHSGETVGQVLKRMRDARAEVKGSLPDTFALMLREGPNLALVEPFLEPMAFVLEDAHVRTDPRRGEDPLIEVASLFPEGSPQPAWAELLRTRYYVVLSDGLGYVRMFLPGRDPERAYQTHYGAVRHVLNWLRTCVPARALDVEVFAYRNNVRETEFTLNLESHRFKVPAELGPPHGRRPFDAAAIQRFFEAGYTLEAAKVTDENELVLIGSKQECKPTLNGAPVSLADLAVAYRAVGYAGEGEVYMSLDRGKSPEVANVNFGGRLRNTRIGWVTLRCDQRFKTISDSVDPHTHEPLADSIRRKIPDFQTQEERQVHAPQQEKLTSEETRFWYYPDSVMVRVGPGRAMKIQSSRFTAAAERTDAGGLPGDRAAQTPRWTREALEHFNKNYEAFGEIFPELRELDQVGRLLALAAWLRQLQNEANPPIDADGLLDVGLPRCMTPRQVPQTLITYWVGNAGPSELLLFDVSFVSDQFAARRRSGQLDRAWRKLGPLALLANRYKSEHRLLEELAAQAGAEALRKVKGPNANKGNPPPFKGAVAITGGLDLDFRGRVKDAPPLKDPDRRLIDEVARFPQRREVTPQGANLPYGRTVSTPGGGGKGPPPPVAHAPAAAGADDPSGGRRLGATGYGVLGVAGADGKEEGRRIGPESSTSGQGSKSVFWAENGVVNEGRIPSVFTLYEDGEGITYRLQQTERGVLVATREQTDQRSAEADARVVAQAIKDGRSPHFAWQALAEGTPVMAVERLPDGSVAVLSHGRTASGPVELRPVKDGRVSVANEGADATRVLRQAARDFVRSASDQAVSFVYVEGSGDKLRIQYGARTSEVRLDQVEAFLANRTDPAPNPLDGIFRAAGGPKDFVVYRDAFARRPERFGGSFQKGAADEPLAFAAALRERYGAEGVRVHLDDEPVPAKRRLAAITPVLSKNDLALVIPEGTFEVRDEGALRDVGPAWENAQMSVRPTIDATVHAGNVMVLTGHNSEELFKYLQELGNKGVLKDRVWLLLTCGENGNANMIHELMERYGARAFAIFPEQLEPAVVARVLRKLPAVVEESVRKDRRLNALELIGETARQVQEDKARPVSERMKIQLERLRRGVLQLSDRREQRGDTVTSMVA
jgi:hypothetical protein